jgi:carboxypeptidase T
MCASTGRAGADAVKPNTQRARRMSRPGLALGLLLVVAVAAPGPTAAASMPAGYGPYHTYAELEAVLDATVASYPQIARKFSIGKSYHGRQIWGLKISDNVERDEDEPEVLFDSLVHARERLTVEMSIYLIRLLTEKHGVNERITRIVDTTEIYLLPMVNPDGGEYDIKDGRFRNWRKNRQPNPGHTAIGTDLNRNFGFKWGCCGGSSGKPAAGDYRGSSAFSTPEARAYRDFVDSRVVGGRQQIRAAISWHANGEYVMWPYGYTTTNVPKTMTVDDHKVLVTIGREMARLNGYIPQQMSRMYTMDGDTSSWLYGKHRVFAYTLELYPPDDARGMARFYPPASLIGRETERNRKAVLYLLEQADCPYRAAGLGSTHCGPLNDDFETGRGWRVNPAGTDTATKGAWQRAKPEQSRTSAGIKQRGAVPSGRLALVTGAKAGAKPNANDLDGGLSSVRSARLELDEGSGWRLSFRYYFAHDKRASSADFLRLRVVANGTSSTVFERRGKASERNAAWASVTLNLDAWAGQDVRLLWQAADKGSDSLIEAAIDDVRLYR